MPGLDRLNALKEALAYNRSLLCEQLSACFDGEFCNQD
jgi:hypothetical protein